MLVREIEAFRDQVARPRMLQLLQNTHIPEGMCCIDNLELSYIDGRSWGVDSQIKASGLLYRNGRVEEYTFDECDFPFADFIATHKNYVFVSDGTLKLWNELEETEITSKLRNTDFCSHMFPELSQAGSLRVEMNLIEYTKMKLQHKAQSDYVFDHEIMISDDFTKVEGYLWATEALISRLKAQEQSKLSPEELESMDNMNFYPVYDVQTGTVSLQGHYYYQSAEGETGVGFNLPLDPYEAYWISELFEAHCKGAEGMSCLDFVNQVRQEHGMASLPPQDSLSNRIQSAESRVSSTPDPNAKIPECEL